MKAQSMASGRVAASTQQYLDIAEIKDDVVVMRDGSIRGVLMVSSINFALKSEDEQNAIIGSYVGFLNNLDFPIQIVIQSRELNIDAYLAALAKREKEQTNELLRLQTGEYARYVKELVAMSRIMSKRFYVVVPYTPVSDQTRSFWSRLSAVFQPTTVMRMKEEHFTSLRSDLLKRVDKILSGLSGMGLNCALLDTQGLIELYYSTYNPTTALHEKMTDTRQLRVE